MKLVCLSDFEKEFHIDDSNYENWVPYQCCEMQKFDPYLLRITEDIPHSGTCLATQAKLFDVLS